VVGRDEGGQLEYQYTTERGQIVLRGEADQLAAAAEMKETIELLRAENDPWMFELGGLFSQKSQFLKVNRELGPLFEVVDFEVEKFSRWKLDDAEERRQWYTPVCVLRAASGRLFVHQGAVILIRDPFAFGRLASQFRLAGMKSRLDGIWLDIVETDFEFDALMGACLQLSLGAIIDPAIDANGRFDGGMAVEPMPMTEARVQRLFEA
jgi:uncharacterized protein YneR